MVASPFLHVLLDEFLVDLDAQARAGRHVEVAVLQLELVHREAELADGVEAVRQKGADDVQHLRRAAQVAAEVDEGKEGLSEVRQIFGADVWKDPERTKSLVDDIFRQNTKPIIQHSMLKSVAC